VTTQWNPDKYLTGKKTRKVKLLLDECESCNTNGIAEDGSCDSHETTGDFVEITIQELSWNKRNQIMSESLNWDTDGNTGFQTDIYTKAVLKEIIVEAPWGPTTDMFLIQVGDQLGAALDTLVPKPFAQYGRNDNRLSIDEAKKE